MYRKEVVYDYDTRDYAMYLDGELTGFARTYHEAEVTLDQLIFELMSGSHFTAPTTPAFPMCPSCGDTQREPGLCTACRENALTDIPIASDPDPDPMPDDAPGGDCDDHGPYAGDDCDKCDDICCNSTMPCDLCGSAHSLVACPDHRALILNDRVLTPRVLARLLMKQRTLALDFLRGLTPDLFHEQAGRQVAWMREVGTPATVDEWKDAMRRVLDGKGSRLRRTYHETQAAMA